MNRLKEVRKEHGLTLKQLSKMLDERGLLSVKNNTLSQYENEKREPSIQALKAYAEIFNASIDYLLGNVSEIDSVSDTCREEQEDPEKIKRLTDWYDFKYCPYCGRKLSQGKTEPLGLLRFVKAPFDWTPKEDEHEH